MGTTLDTEAAHTCDLNRARSGKADEELRGVDEPCRGIVGSVVWQLANSSRGGGHTLDNSLDQDVSLDREYMFNE